MIPYTTYYPYQGRRCLYEPSHENLYLLTCRPNRDFNHPVHPQSEHSLHFCMHEETLHPWLSKVCQVKIPTSARMRTQIRIFTGCTSRVERKTIVTQTYF